MSPHGHHDQDSPHGHAAHRRKLRLLYLSVGGVTALIVGMWVILVPGQYEGFSLFSDRERADWRDIREVTDRENAGMQASLESMRAALDAESEASAGDGTSGPAFDDADLEALRARLQAASKKNHIDDNDHAR